MMMTYVSAVAKDRGGLYGDIDEQLMRLIASGLSREELTEAVKKVRIDTRYQFFNVVELISRVDLDPHTRRYSPTPRSSRNI